jgi:hypothetical protein
MRATSHAQWRQTTPHLHERVTARACSDDHDRFERTLVAEGLLRSPSQFHDLDAAGVVTPQAGSTC